MLRFDENFRIGAKNSRNVFCFLDNCIELVAVTSHYYQVNTCHLQLTNRPKISDITNRNIFRLHFPHNDKKIDKSAVLQISAVFGTL